MPHAGATLAIQTSEFSQRLFFEHGWLVASSCDADIQPTIWAFLVPCEAHDVWQAAVTHQNFDSAEQLFDVSFPEILIPLVGSVKACEAVEFHDGVRIPACYLDFPLDQFRICNIIESKNVIAVITGIKKKRTALLRQQALIQALLELKRFPGRFQLHEQRFPL